jgi:hypothetical protein
MHRAPTKCRGSTFIRRELLFRRAGVGGGVPDPASLVAVGLCFGHRYVASEGRACKGESQGDSENGKKSFHGFLPLRITLRRLQLRRNAGRLHMFPLVGVEKESPRLRAEASYRYAFPRLRRANFNAQQVVQDGRTGATKRRDLQFNRMLLE